MKTCTNCKKDLPITEFAFKNKAKNIRTSYCDECRREKSKVSYYKHHQKNLARIKQNKKSNVQWYRELKNSLSCCVCGESESVCLDFHHINEDSKEFLVSKIQTRSKRFLIKELNKCACLCANCHRKHHAGVLNKELTPLQIDIPL